MCKNSEKPYIKRVFLIVITSIILMLLLSTRTEAKTQYDSLTFDAEYYINVYPDIKNAYGNDYQSAYNHFITFGIKEGRKGSPYFDVYYYLNQNSDLQKAFGNNYELAYNHFISSGINENRAGSPYIDPAYYAKRYSDIKNAYGNDYRGIYYHFYTNGIKEGRKGNIYFDVEYYLTKNADLEKALGKGNYEAAFNHFLYNGIGELREASSDVNIKCYLESNKDLQSAYGNNKNYIGLFEHCYINGIKDKRLLNHTIVNMEEVSPTCISKGQTGGKKCKYCGEIIESPKILNESNHNWQKPEITWDGLNATAKVVCSVCGKKEDAHVTVDEGKVTKEPSCGEEGEKTYTATVTYGDKTVTDTKTESIPATGNHIAGDEAKFVWSKDNKTVTATFKCTVCNSELTANVTVDEGKVTKEPSCGEEGEKIYTAIATYGDKTATDTKNESIPATGNHIIGNEAKFVWSEDNKTVTATFKCTVCQKDLQASVAVSEQVVNYPTCSQQGEKTYTATATYGDKTATDTKTESIPATGNHTAGNEATFVWSGNKTATATFKCTVCKATLQADVTVSEKVTKYPTCSQQGSRTYTATATYNGKTIKTESRIESISATNQHNFGKWQLNSSTGKLERKCQNSGCNNTETKQEEKTTFSVIKPDSTPDLTEWGYDHQNSGNYNLVSEDNNNGKLSGIIVEQKLQENVYGSDKATGFYFAITIDPTNKKVDDLDSSVKFIPTVNVVNGDVNKTLVLENEDDTLTLLVRVDEENCKNDACKNNCTCCQEGKKVKDCKDCTKKVTIKVDLDGTKQAYTEETYTIDYCNVTFEKDSKFEITKDLPTSAMESIKNTFQGWGFNPEQIANFEEYKNNLTIEQDSENNHLVKVKGLLPLMKLTNDKGFGEEAKNKDGYYFIYVIKTEKSVGKSSESEGTFGNVEVKIPQNEENGMNPTKIVKKDDFDTDNEIAVLMKVTPKENKDDQKFKVIVDMDGNGKGCAPYEITIDYSELEFQQQTKAEITINGSKNTSDVPESDKKQLEEWGYKFPDDIKLESENNKAKNKPLNYDSKTGLLTGAIKEQKLTGGFDEDELDSYFYTFTIKPEKVTDDIKVTIEDSENNKKEYTKNDFTGNILTILQHIPTEFTKCNGGDECCSGGSECKDATKCKKSLKIIVDSDGDSKNNYKQSEIYYIDYCNVDFIKLHTVTFKDNNGNEISTEDIYDGEKVKKPEDPKTELSFNEFDYWAKDGSDSESKEKFDFDNKGITEDVELSPIWSVDVDGYINKSLENINKSESVKEHFNINLEQGDDSSKILTVKISDNEDKLSEIKNTGIITALAKAMNSGEVSDIDIELKDKEASLNGETLKEAENEIEEKIKSQIVDNLLKELLTDSYESKTLKDLCDTCSEGQEEPISQNQLTITLDKNIAHPKNKELTQSENYEIKFERKCEVKFEAGALENPEPQNIDKGENLTLPELEMDGEYRKLDGWYSDKNTKVENNSQVNNDMILTAHYTLNVDKFVEEVVEDLNSSATEYSDNFDGKFNLKKEENNITINIDSPNVPLTTLAETSIPGTIAYILNNNGIENITLNVGNQSETFTSSYKATEGSQYEETNDRDQGLLGDSGISLKNEIIKGAKTVFNKELSNNESKATLDQLEYSDKTFSLKIGNVSDDATIKLVKDDSGTELSSDTDKTYTFKFDSDFVVVNQNDGTNLNAKKIDDALEKVDSKNYDIIYIDGDITSEDTITIDVDKIQKENLEIKAIENTQNEMSLASEDVPTVSVSGGDKDYVFDIKSASSVEAVSEQSKTINISNLKLSGGKKAELKVENGVNVVVDNLDVSGIEKSEEFNEDEKDFPAGIILSSGNLTVSNLKNDSENYDVPTIRIPKESYTSDKQYNGTVTILNGTNMTKNNDIYTKVEKVRADYDNHKTVYDRCYYLDQKNSEIYCIMFIDELNKKSGHVFSMYKYYYKDEKIDNDEIDEYRNNFWKRELEEIEKQIEKNPENKVQLEEKKKSIQESKQKAESANFSGWFKDKDTSERIVDLSTETLKNGTTYRAKYSN